MAGFIISHLVVCMLGMSKLLIIVTFCFPSVGVSTVCKGGVGTPIVLCGGFFSGLLEALLGKPGTLHSPGQIITSASGVPPDLRGASVLGRSLGVHGWVEGVGCILADPVGRVCLSYQAGTFPPRPKAGGYSSNSFTPRPSTCYFLVSQARRSFCFPTAALWSGGGSRLTRLVLHSTPQSATVWIGRLPPPGRNRIYTLRPHGSPCPVAGLYLQYVLLFFFRAPDATIWLSPC